MAVSLASLAVAGCAAHAPADTVFPKPLVDPLPLRMGVSYPEAFRTYEYSEKIPGDREWIVTLGPANKAMFSQLFDAMFAETVVLDPAADENGDDPPTPGEGGGTAAAAAPPLDAILVPSIESYEFANPVDWDSEELGGASRGDDEFTTVWITYRLRLEDPNGRVIAEIPVRAYGRSPYHFMGAKKSLVEATHMAMRDAGAYISLHFADEPRIREWLRENGLLENRQ